MSAWLAGSWMELSRLDSRSSVTIDCGLRSIEALVSPAENYMDMHWRR